MLRKHGQPVIDLIIQELVITWGKDPEILVIGDKTTKAKLAGKFRNVTFSRTLKSRWNQSFDVIYVGHPGDDALWRKKQLVNLVGLVKHLTTNGCLVIMAANPVRALLAGPSSKERSTDEAVAGIDELIFRLEGEGCSHITKLYSLRDSTHASEYISSRRTGTTVGIRWEYDDVRLNPQDPPAVHPVAASAYSQTNNELLEIFSDNQLLICYKNTPPRSIVYIKATPQRKNNFAIYTAISRNEQQELHVVKVALSAESKKFVGDFHKHHDQLQRHAGQRLTISKPTVESPGRVSFAYAEGETLYDVLRGHLARNAPEHFIADFNKYRKLLESLGTRSANPSDVPDFTRIFGRHYKAKTSCLVPGVLDMNFDNLIVDGGTYTLIDYEWVFDFPIPRQFVELRALYYFFLSNRNLVNKLAAEGVAMTQITTWVRVPTSIYKELRPLFKSIGQVLESDKSFQQHASRASASTDRPDFSSSPIIDKQPQLLADFVRNASRATKALRTENAELVHKNQTLARNLEAILSSRRWRMASLVSSVFHSLKPHNRRR